MTTTSLSAKIHVSYVKCGHDHASEQLALPCHSKVTLELIYFIFLSETWNMMIWDGLVQPTRKYYSICHLEYPEFQTRIISLGQSDYVLNVTFTMGWFTGIQALILKQMALIDNEKSIIKK